MCQWPRIWMYNKRIVILGKNKMFVKIVEVKVLKSEINKFSIIIVTKLYCASVLFKLYIDYYKILIKYYFLFFNIIFLGLLNSK